MRAMTKTPFVGCLSMARYNEIERKFLVKSLPPGWKRNAHKKIVQGYLPICSRNLEIRLRKQDSKYLITIKAGHGQKRLEKEMEIPKKLFQTLWPLTRGARITKTRYEIPLDHNVVQVDVYHGPHRGLVLAEIEFDSERQGRSFRPPDWFGPEVTGKRRYANEALSRCGSLP